MLSWHSCRSAFFWYSQDARPKVRAANPDFGVGDIAKELGRQWGEASDETRDDESSVLPKWHKLKEKIVSNYGDVAFGDIELKLAWQGKVREAGGKGPREVRCRQAGVRDAEEGPKRGADVDVGCERASAGGCGADGGVDGSRGPDGGGGRSRLGGGGIGR